MKARWIVSSLISGAVALLILGGHAKQHKAEAVNVNAGSGNEATKAVTGQEEHKTYQATAGAQIDVSNISGPVSVEATAASSQSVSSTTYAGGYGVPGAFFFTALELVDTGGVVSGKMYQPYDRADTPPLQNLIMNGEKLTFNVDHLYFVLQRTAYGYSGFVRDEKGKRDQKQSSLRDSLRRRARSQLLQRTTQAAMARLEISSSRSSVFKRAKSNSHLIERTSRRSAI